MMITKRHIPNILSLARLLLSAGLLLGGGNRYAAVAVMALCGLSDALDGYLARRWQVQSQLGARLDSLGDFVFFACLTIHLLFWHQGVVQDYVWIIVLVVAVRLGSLVACLIRNNQFYGLHTIANKLAGLAIFLGFGLYFLTQYRFMVVISLVIALVAALEELVVMLMAKSPDPNLRGIWRASRKSPPEGDGEAT